jgi:hypothetical protein
MLGSGAKRGEAASLHYLTLVFHDKEVGSGGGRSEAPLPPPEPTSLT